MFRSILTQKLANPNELIAAFNSVGRVKAPTHLHISRGKEVNEYFSMILVVGITRCFIKRSACKT